MIDRIPRNPECTDQLQRSTDSNFRLAGAYMLHGFEGSGTLSSVSFSSRLKLEVTDTGAVTAGGYDLFPILDGLADYTLGGDGTAAIPKDRIGKLFEKRASGIHVVNELFTIVYGVSDRSINTNPNSGPIINATFTETMSRQRLDLERAVFIQRALNTFLSKRQLKF